MRVSELMEAKRKSETASFKGQEYTLTTRPFKGGHGFHAVIKRLPDVYNYISAKQFDTETEAIEWARKVISGEAKVNWYP